LNGFSPSLSPNSRGRCTARALRHEVLGFYRQKAIEASLRRIDVAGITVDIDRIDRGKMPISQTFDKRASGERCRRCISPRVARALELPSLVYDVVVADELQRNDPLTHTWQDGSGRATRLS
jgi:hypothetical protein